MQREKIRNVVTEQFYRSLDESGVTVDAVPHSQLQAIVSSLADGVFAALEALEEDDQPTRPAATAGSSSSSGSEEEVLWQGKPAMSLGERYELTSQRLRIFRGIFNRQLEEIDLVRVRDTKVKQHLGERALNVGDITIISTDPSKPNVMLNNVKDPMTVRELIRGAYLKEQERRGLRYREE